MDISLIAMHALGEARGTRQCTSFLRLNHSPPCLSPAAAAFGRGAHDAACPVQRRAPAL
jgi:hypothetical protein